MNLKSKPAIIVSILAIIIVAAGLWYSQQGKSSLPVPAEPITQMPGEQNTADISMGSQILERTQHPLTDKFPETNPLKQIIKNPF